MADWLIWQWLLAHFEILVGFLIGVILIARVLTQKRSPTGTLAWLLAIILIPYVGVPLYLIFGGRKMKRQARRKTGLDLSRHGKRFNVERTYLDELLESYGLPPACPENRLQLCPDGQETYHRLVEMIENAKKSIYISTFIFHRDSVGKDILRRLVSKARQGLDVRVLLDGVGSVWTGRLFFKTLVKVGGQYAFFIPLLHWPFRGRTNLRNHRKIVIVDQQTVLAGGTNIGREYMGPYPDPKRWQDLSFVLEGPAVRFFLEIFRSDWLFAAGSKDKKPVEIEDKPLDSLENPAVVQVVPSGPDVKGDALYDAILLALFNAQKRIWIVTPYFVPDEPLAKALRLAVRKGIDVRVIVPAKSNHPLTDLVRSGYLRDLQQIGAKILFYMPGMIHAKALLVDDNIVMIGSANMDFRSLFLNYEIMLIAYSQPHIEQVQSWISQVESHCRKPQLTAGYTRDLLEHIARLFAPLL
jgi:cardiolipin synthase